MRVVDPWINGRELRRLWRDGCTKVYMAGCLASMTFRGSLA